MDMKFAKTNSLLWDLCINNFQRPNNRGNSMLLLERKSLKRNPQGSDLVGEHSDHVGDEDEGCSEIDEACDLEVNGKSDCLIKFTCFLHAVPSVITLDGKRATDVVFNHSASDTVCSETMCSAASPTLYRSPMPTQQMEAREHQQQLQMQQQLQLIQQCNVQYQQQRQDPNHPALGGPINGMNSEGMIGQPSATVLATEMYEERMVPMRWIQRNL
ncbi:hypothetical protein RHMOL_Rhmol03G0162300 [Rhododendron molle]|uniref:Uncharacterized protein n=1 Tax=Rhododendron molle TaxID=49168 RepID=A0ACC0PGM4_RHOML|nr:hypothetical protein RHMOL_Rhmol03G0162300 [Rhododendron molle]